MGGWVASTHCISPSLPVPFLMQVRATHQMSSRHDDLRDERLSSHFVRNSPKLGKYGADILCNVSNGGKTNANGNIVYCGAAPHRNPLLCCIFARACLLLTRFHVSPACFNRLAVDRTSPLLPLVATGCIERKVSPTCWIRRTIFLATCYGKLALLPRASPQGLHTLFTSGCMRSCASGQITSSTMVEDSRRGARAEGWNGMCCRVRVHSC